MSAEEVPKKVESQRTRTQSLREIPKVAAAN
jgi:hypothetical protein